MRRAYKILASIGMVALSTAVGLGVRHFVAVRKRRKGQGGCDAPEHVDETAAEAQELDEAEDEDASEAEEDEDDSEAADNAEDTEAAENDADADDSEDEAEDSEEDEEDIAPVSEDGEIVESDTEIHPDTVSSSDDAGASDAEV